MRIGKQKSGPTMKLWQKDYSIFEHIERFTVGNDRLMDLYLAPHDVIGSIAHAKMLTSIGLLETSELDLLLKELRKIYQTIMEGNFSIAEGMEDVHSQVEWMLTQQLGDVGKKIHSGRSRNDQVLVDLRLFFRDELKKIADLVLELAEKLLEKSEQHKNTLMPGYTHMQVAMVSSFGLWFGAYAESLADDLHLLESTYQIVNQNPLGSAAGYGSSFPLNRTLTTQLLGFNNLNYNVIHAQMGRGKTELFISFVLAAIAHTVGKFAMDVVLYCSQNYGFIRLPKELTTGSSIMPHKKNPDVFELIRGYCNKIQALPQEISMMTSGLPAGYHRDFQLLKEVIFPAIHSLKDTLSILIFSVEHIEVKQNLLNHSQYAYLYTVEAVNELVMQGVPFREAYQRIGKAVEDGTYEYKGTVQHTHEGSIGNLCTAQIQQKLSQHHANINYNQVEQAIQALLSE